MKTIYVSGVFDMFHYGHVRLLKKCEEIAYELMIKLREPVRLLIGVHNDADCANYKRKPIMSMNERSTSIIELIEWLASRGLFVAVLIDAPLIETKEFYESKTKDQDSLVADLMEKQRIIYLNFRIHTVD